MNIFEIIIIIGLFFTFGSITKYKVELNSWKKHDRDTVKLQNILSQVSKSIQRRA